MKFFKLYAILSILFSVSCGPSIYDLAQRGNNRYDYSLTAINYFQEIGFGSELGVTSGSPVVNKWELSQIQIGLHGDYTSDDESELQNITFELSQLTGISFTIVYQQFGDINIHIIPQNQFSSVLPREYNPNNPQDGFFVTNFSNRGVISKATILIRNNSIGAHRKHLLREELTQCMGIMKDSSRTSSEYINSIFQQDPSREPTAYSSIDKDVIRLLYDRRVRPGMTQQELLTALRSSAVV